MAPTTTVRVDVATHQQLIALAAALRADKEAWGEYLCELESTHVSDGVG